MANNEYEVGYGKPPLHSRFKKGQSGNVHGRPKNSLNLRTIVEAALRERIVVTENGKRRKISKLEIAVKQLANKAAAGDPRSTRQVLDLFQILGLANIPTSQHSETLSEADQQMLKNLQLRLRPQDDGENQ